jgi:hypothetical protein
VGGRARDVFVVGGPLGNEGFETLAMRWDGEAWHDLQAHGKETFWWVSGTSATDVWMVGTEGRIAHWDGTTFTAHDAGTTTTLWGVQAFARDDVWVVGGAPGEGTKAANDLVLHWDGKSFTREVLPGEPLGRALFKVWGPRADDLYVVGELGTIWHRQGATWTLVPTRGIATGTLFTVHGCSSSDVWAVGNADVLHSDGTRWSRVDVPLSSTVNGVSCARPGSVAIVGAGSLKQRWVGGAWVDESEAEPHDDFHAVWGDPATGDLWAVGGDFLSGASARKRRGVVARFGGGAP